MTMSSLCFIVLMFVVPLSKAATVA
jgi:hypothetical protein